MLKDRVEPFYNWDRDSSYMADRRSKSGRHKSPNRLSAFHIITWIWALVTLVVVATILFAPRKPPAPPPSEMSYEAPPPESLLRRRDPFIETASMETPSATVAQQKPIERFAIFGYVTEGATDEPVARAGLACRLIQSEEQKQLFDKLLETAQTTQKQEDRNRFLEFEAKFNSSSARTTTGRDGAYEMRLSEPGEYVVTVWARGYRSEEDGQAVMTEESPEARADFEMSRGATISGRVSESDTGAGAPGISVHAYSDEDGRGDDARTDEDGNYTITGLEPGTYHVSLELHHTPYDVSDKIPAQDVTIAEDDEQVTGIDFVVEAAGVV